MNSPLSIPSVNRGLGISLILISMLAPLANTNALAASASTKSTAVKTQSAPSLDQAPYSGAGKYPVGIALARILPSVSAIYLNNSLSMDQVVSWNVQDGTVGDALNQVFHPLQLDWRLSNNALTITEGAPYMPASAPARSELAFASGGSAKAVADDGGQKTGDIKAASLGSPVVAVVEAPVQVWKLKQGETIRSELSKWAGDSGWALVWQLDKDWVVPADSVFTGAFDSASANVIETLASNGVLIHANFYTANKTLVVNGPGVTPK